ncbi:MAG TPA: hypothetical protein VFA90_06215 [Terriglobales bacterium]|jgi:hypothetical protein|nr:hypothetical protein [Terriglobales bacterium]
MGFRRAQFAVIVSTQAKASTHEYDRTITVANGKNLFSKLLSTLAVELRADTVRILDQTANSEPGEATQMTTEDDVPALRGLVRR